MTARKRTSLARKSSKKKAARKKPLPGNGAAPIQATNSALSIDLGSMFAAVAHRFLPVIAENIADSHREMTFGATVHVRRDLRYNVLVARMVPHEPKVPLPGMADFSFILQQRENGEIEKVFMGSYDDFAKAADGALSVATPSSEEDTHPN